MDETTGEFEACEHCGGSGMRPVIPAGAAEWDPFAPGNRGYALMLATKYGGEQAAEEYLALLETKSK